MNRCQTISTACIVAQGILTSHGRHERPTPPSSAAGVGQAVDRRRRRSSRSPETDEAVSTVGGQDGQGRASHVSFDGLTGEVELGKARSSRPSEILQVVDRTARRQEVGPPSAASARLLEPGRTRCAAARHPRQRGTCAGRSPELAYAFGARGIGLCRTEHMFFGGRTRLPIVQQHDPRGQRGRRDRKKALRRAASRSSARISTASSRRCTVQPVTIRTIDPPLHEFLPKREELMVECRAGSKCRAATAGAELDAKIRSCSRASSTFTSSTPCLGHRGVRLGITYPEIAENADPRHHRGGDPARQGKNGLKVIPEDRRSRSSAHVKELRDQKAVVDRVAEPRTMKELPASRIEVPRRAR